MEESAEFVTATQEEIRFDIGSLFRGAIRVALECLLEEQVKEMVGARRYERLGSRKDRLNGTCLRGLLTSMGHIDVSVPRTRQNGSPVEVLGRYKRRTADMDRLVTTAYVEGVSTRDMKRLSESLMGEGVSRSAVSRVTKVLGERVEALRQAPIDEPIPYLYLDATFLDARWSRTVENVSALVAYGVDPSGHRRLLGITIGTEESEESWSERVEPEVRGRLDRIIEKNLPVVIGDANGADKAVQGYLSGRRFEYVEVFSADESARNNVGNWPVRVIRPDHSRKDFDYYATKDRAMARAATVGLMLWDGRSRGTLMNVLRLCHLNKPVVVYVQSGKGFIDVRTRGDLSALLSALDPHDARQLRADARAEGLAEGLAEQRALGL